MENEIIYAYTRSQAVEDGEQVLLEGELAALAREHYKVPVYMTRAVFETVRRAVENEKHCNDYAGVIHDMLWMSRVCSRSINEESKVFTVIITGVGRKRNHQMVAQVGPTDIDDPSPALTIMFPEEM